MKKVTAEKFIHDTIVSKTDIDKYVDILERFERTDVSEDMKFQRLFTWFYRIRRSKKWLEGYYRTFQNLRNEKNLGIKTILTELDRMAGGEGRSLELSFASKMLATINPEMPIWDSLVKRNLDLPDAPAVTEPDRIEKGSALYDLLCDKMFALCNDPAIDVEIGKFDSILPEYSHISKMKKLDYMIWALN